MPSFPFLQLPFPVQLLILDNLDILQLLDFSLLSRETAKIAKSGKRKVTKLYWYINDFTKKHEIIFYNSKSYSPFAIFHLQIPLKQEWMMQSSDRKGALKIDKTTLEVSRGQRNNSPFIAIGCDELSNEERLKLLEKLSEHLLDILEVEFFEILTERPSNVNDFFIWKYTKKLVRLVINPYCFDQTVSAREMDFILDELTIENFYMGCKVEEGYQYSKPLEMETIKLMNVNWLTENAFLNTQCKRWEILSSSLVLLDLLNLLIKKSLDGGLEHLELCQIPMASTEGFNQVLQGVQTLTAENLPESWKSIELIRDLQRDDGKKAIAFVEQSVFKFLIWTTGSIRPER